MYEKSTMATGIIITFCVIVFFGNVANGEITIKLTEKQCYDMVRAATAADNLDLVNLLTFQGCSVNRPAGMKSKEPTPLHIAVINDSLQMVKLLVYRGADLEARAFMSAEVERKPSVVPMCKYLLEEGSPDESSPTFNNTEKLYSLKL